MSQSTSVAALYVYADGVYADVPGVEIWDEERDARTYPGPHPVVAHPPCKSWSLMSNCRPEILKNEDGGCFAAALRAVRRYGGVLEHPAHSRAWKWFQLPEPQTEAGWTRSLTDSGCVCEVDQRWYGHEANKPTWLYYVGMEPPPVRPWRAPAGSRTVGRSLGPRTRPEAFGNAASVPRRAARHGAQLKRLRREGDLMSLSRESDSAPARKLCTGCGERKPLDDFYRNKNRPDGRGSRCKTCHRQAQYERWLQLPVRFQK